MIGNRIVNEDLRKIAAFPADWQRFNGKNVLITGAGGFLAAYLVETLLYLKRAGVLDNVTVYAMVRDIQKAKKRFSAHLNDKNLVILVQDVCDQIAFNEPIHFIVHAASQASPKYYGIDPVGTLNANTIGTHNLLNLCRYHPVESFLFISSSEVYGALDESKIPTGELDFGYLDPLQVRSCYAESKRLGETMCVSWLHQYDVPARIARPFHTYGPGMHENDGRVHADFIADIVHNRDIVMHSDGRAIRAFCYVADATTAFFQVLLSGKNGEAYNVGNTAGEISIFELASKLVGLFPERGLKVIKSTVLPEGYLSSVVSRISPDLSKIEKLGWVPDTDLDSGFYRTIISYG